MDFTASTFEIKFTWPGKQLDIGKVADYKVHSKYDMGLAECRWTTKNQLMK